MKERLLLGAHRSGQDHRGEAAPGQAGPGGDGRGVEATDTPVEAERSGMVKRCIVKAGIV